jgi:hypothetical protein
MGDLRLVSGNEDDEHNNGDVMRIWERQPGETNRAFAAFAEYLQMGPSRSLAKLGQKLGKTTQHLEAWSVRNDWQRRVAAFSRHETKVINDRIVEGVAAMRERQAIVGQQLQARAQQRILRMTETEINELHPTEATGMLRVGAELERSARALEDGEASGFGLDMPAPQFTIQYIFLPPLEQYARIQLEGDPERPAVIPRENLDNFLVEFPKTVVIC